MNNMHEIKYKEPFISSKNPKVLILGTIPGNKSNKLDFYYEDNHNFIWKIFAKIFNEKIPKTLEEKKALLLKYDISLWDIYAQVIRPIDSSEDNKAIKQIPNDKILEKFDPQYIICNGKEAYNVFLKQYPNFDTNNIFQVFSSSGNTRKWSNKLENLRGWEILLDLYK